MGYFFSGGRGDGGKDWIIHAEHWVYNSHFINRSYRPISSYQTGLLTMCPWYPFCFGSFAPMPLLLPEIPVLITSVCIFQCSPLISILHEDASESISFQSLASFHLKLLKKILQRLFWVQFGWQWGQEWKETTGTDWAEYCVFEKRVTTTVASEGGFTLSGVLEK